MMIKKQVTKVDKVDNAVIFEKLVPARDCWGSVDNEKKKNTFDRCDRRGVFWKVSADVGLREMSDQ